MATDNTQLVRSMYDLYNQRQIDQMVNLVSDRIEVVNVPFDDTQRGKESFRSFVQNWATAFPDSRLEVKNIFASDTGAVAEFIGRGTHTGQLTGPAGNIAATGKKLELHFCDVLQIQGGKISSLHTYWDMNTLLMQLGLTSPARPGAKTTEPRGAGAH